MSALWTPAWYGAHDVEIQCPEKVTIIVRSARTVDGAKVLPSTQEARMEALAVAQRIASNINGESDNPDWPLWAKELLAVMREYTGERYDEIDLPEELRNWWQGYRCELEREASLIGSAV